ncbi:hypothetical protein K505DRAFT_381310 [Melanomma pulvis-pyrius CBS 109.77]|uniref:Uncharacterized protein n=1 Tax=Melanomma pulvis-pyrius CBS 109.77 TaxID=1314802 RepID=A0A6A6WNK8_9PLEO|nr:hypothetical protein K505DRAFT_381310 [Melanomma pulvis-pyrius CBS 109.77]
MYTQALQGYEQVEETIYTVRNALRAMWDLASLYDRQHRVEDAKLLYAKALAGYQQVYGDNDAKCRALRDALAALALKEDAISAGTETESPPTRNRPQTQVHDVTCHQRPVEIKAGSGSGSGSAFGGARSPAPRAGFSGQACSIKSTVKNSEYNCSYKYSTTTYNTTIKFQHRFDKETV